jgi:hypothetical protein
MGIFSDSNLQKFLTVYHGQLLSTFFYDLIVRNVVRLVQNKLEWSYISNIALGVAFSLAIIWAIFAVWARVRRNLIICLVVLVVIFVVRIGVGIPDFIERFLSFSRAKLYIYLKK